MSLTKIFIAFKPLQIHHFAQITTPTIEIGFFNESLEEIILIRI